MHLENIMTDAIMKEFIKKNVSFDELEKDKGIYEFCVHGDNSLGFNPENISLGISFEDIDGEKDVYIYNIFAGEEYINISGRGLIENPIPDDVLNELVEVWNGLVYSEEMKIAELISKGLDIGIIKVEVEDVSMNEIKVSVGEHWFWTYVEHLDNQTLLDSVSKEELVKKITDTLIDMKENLSEDEYLYYKYYLEEKLVCDEVKEMGKRKRLTDKEFNLITTWTRKTHIDEVIDIHTGHSGNDYFMDYEENKKLSLEKGFKEIADAVAYPFTHEGFSYEESKILLNLFEEFLESEKKLQYIRDLNSNLNNEIQTDKMKGCVKEWFVKKHPDDKLGTEIAAELTFGDILETLKKGENVYELIGVADSFVREQIFDEIADRLGVRYDDIYDLWLDGPSSNIKLWEDKEPKIVIEKSLDLDEKIANAKKDIPQIPLDEINAAIAAVGKEETRKLNDVIKDR